jgi:hypothetical protein
MATKKPDTPRDPVKEVFGERALLNLTARDLRAGLDRLKTMQDEALALIKAIHKGTVDGILAGTPGAVDSMLLPDAEMEQARRWKLAISAAIEAAEIAEEQVGKREKDATLAIRRKALVEDLDKHQAAADRLQAAIVTVAEAVADLDASGLKALRTAGVRLTAGIGPMFHSEHTRHMINVALFFATNGLWSYERVPTMRGDFKVSQDVAAIDADLLRHYEDVIERQIGRAVDWDTVPETVGAGA